MAVQSPLALSCYDPAMPRAASLPAAVAALPAAAAAAVPLLLALAALTACQRAAPMVEGRPDKVPTFAFAQGPEPRTLDPGFITDAYSGFLAQNLFEGLLVWDAAAAAPQPGMAASWDVGNDGRSWTFHLREDAIWSNGDPVTATDFVVAWRRVLDPDRGSEYASLLYPVAGARGLHDGSISDPAALGVEARDRTTLVVTLAHPTPWFPAILAHHVTAPVPPRVVKRHGFAWTRPENLVVNGPFQLDSWTPGKEILLRRNPYYHDPESVKLERVVARIETDPAKVLSAYDDGDLQWTGHASGLLPLDRLADLSKRPDAHVAAQLGTSWYALRVAGPGAHPALADARVRRALWLALDAASLAGALGPAGMPVASVLPSGMPDYTPAPAPERNPEQARALLAEAGFPGGEGFAPLEIAVDARDLHERVGQWAAATWKRELGIEVTVFPRDFSAHEEAIDAGQFQVARYGWIADYPDPASFLELFHSSNALNTTGWSNKAYDGLVDEAARTGDAASRLRLLAQAEQILLDEMPVLPLFQFGSMTLLKPYVGGYEDNPLDTHLLKWISLGGGPPGMARGD
jgi:oligopeptide transport system substrate-binding protein